MLHLLQNNFSVLEAESHHVPKSNFLPRNKSILIYSELQLHGTNMISEIDCKQFSLVVKYRNLIDFYKWHHRVSLLCITNLKNG